jgi:hypothetical protein
MMDVVVVINISNLCQLIDALKHSCSLAHVTAYHLSFPKFKASFCCHYKNPTYNGSTKSNHIDYFTSDNGYSASFFEATFALFFMLSHCQ